MCVCACVAVCVYERWWKWSIKLHHSSPWPAVDSRDPIKVLNRKPNCYHQHHMTKSNSHHVSREKWTFTNNTHSIYSVLSHAREKKKTSGAEKDKQKWSRGHSVILHQYQYRRPRPPPHTHAHTHKVSSLPQTLHYLFPWKPLIMFIMCFSPVLIDYFPLSFFFIECWLVMD